MVLKALAVGGVAAAVLSVVAAVMLLRPAPPAANLAAEPATLNMVVLPGGVSSPRLQPMQPDTAPALVNNTAPVSLVSAEARLFAADKPFARATQAREAVTAYMGCGE